MLIMILKYSSEIIKPVHKPGMMYTTLHWLKNRSDHVWLKNIFRYIYQYKSKLRFQKDADYP